MYEYRKLKKAGFFPNGTTTNHCAASSGHPQPQSAGTTMSDTEEEEDYYALVADAEAAAEAEAEAAADAAEAEAEAAAEAEAEASAKRARTASGSIASGFIAPLGSASGSADSGAPHGSGGSAPEFVAPGASQEDDDPTLTQDAAFAPEQQRAFDMAMGGSNIFLTGGPGVGKSFTLRKIIEGLEEKHGSGSVLVWAPTGVAAILVGGQTMQSKPGPGIGEHSDQFDNVWGHKKYWRSVRALVLDEVSMADAEFIDWVEASVRAMIHYIGKEANPYATQADQPFGGLQLIFCGDFCQ